MATSRQLSRAGRLGAGLLAVHVVLLFLPPIPPDVKGSLPSYVIGYTAILLLLRELVCFRSALLEHWQRIGRARRWLIGGIFVAAALIGTLALRAVAPEQFSRFSREEGLWEPLTLFCYVGAALLVWSVRGGAGGADGKPWRLMAGLYLLLMLEEIDYFGIFGGLIGRVDGVYAGSLHDIIRLAAEGVLSPAAAALLAATALLVSALLWRAGYLAPRWFGARMGEREFVWVALGFGLLFTAGAEEAHLFGWIAAPPTPEEAIELAGALCLMIYALELASRRARLLRGDAPPTAPPPGTAR